MTKRLATIGFTLCLLAAFASQALARYQNPDWIEVSPTGESFRIEMPNQPRLDIDSVSTFGGNRYTVPTVAATYTLWSIKNPNYKSDQDTDASLDATAELLWEKLLRPDREKLDDKDRQLARMWYMRELPAEG